MKRNAEFINPTYKLMWCIMKMAYIDIAQSEPREMKT